MISKLLDEIKDNKVFVSKVLYNQLISPKISYIEFSKIPDDELIEIAEDFIQYENLQVSKGITKSDFFGNFRNVFKTYNITFLKKMLESSGRLLENFNKKYANFINQNTYIPELTKTISNISKHWEKFQLSIDESLKPAIDQILLSSSIISKNLEPLINFWQNWIEQNKWLFDSFRILWSKFQKQYKISEQEAIQILRKYKWIITPSLPLTFIYEVVKIGKKEGNQRKEINRLFIEYFSSKNFENLENLVNSWEIIEIFKPRMKIFRDCVAVMKNAKSKYNPSNIVLPTLIAQIDGIRIEFMNQNGLSFQTPNKVWKEWFKNLTSDQKLLDLANEIFLNILFQESHPGKPLKIPFMLNRHKIMHGEYIRYGKITHTIRAFLILDFLAIISKRKD